MNQLTAPGTAASNDSGGTKGGDGSAAAAVAMATAAMAMAMSERGRVAARRMTPARHPVGHASNPTRPIKFLQIGNSLKFKP